MESFTLDPPADLCLSSFEAAVKMISNAEGYVLCAHTKAVDVTKYIQDEYKKRGLEVDVLLQDNNDEFGWFVHGVRPNPPFIVGTVFSHMK